MIRIATFFLIASAAALFVAAFGVLPQHHGAGSPVIATAAGIVRVGDEDVVVEVTVLASDAAHASHDAQAALARNYPQASALNTKARGGNTGFTVNGLIGNTLPVSFSDNDDGAPVTGALADLTAAMATWNDVPTSSFAFSYAGTTSRCPSLVDECPGAAAFDGHNDVGWLDLADPTLLGVTWWGTKSKEFDTALDNANFRWLTGCAAPLAGVYNVQAVYLHELGRALGLGTSKDPGSVMQTPYTGRCTLGAVDVEGVSALYPQ
jgi:hypothetical protein